MTNPRPYAGRHDLQKIQALLRAGLQALPYSYVHPGDIEWWFFYNPVGEPPEQSVFLWEDEAGQLLGWATYHKRFMAYDLFVQPYLRGTALVSEILGWGEEALRPFATEETPAIEVGSVFADDASLIALLTEQGYEREENILNFQQDLTRELPTPTLPEGYRFLTQMDVQYTEQRADVHYNAFVPSRMTPTYYEQFMATAPSYQPQNDVVVVAPDEQFVAFAMTWADPILKRGEFEPVGTRNTFQRRGFGRAVMLEGLRRLKAQGMTLATVSCDALLPNNIAFYQSVGFEPVNRVYRYSKTMR